MIIQMGWLDQAENPKSVKHGYFSRYIRGKDIVEAWTVKAMVKVEEEVKELSGTAFYIDADKEDMNNPVIRWTPLSLTELELRIYAEAERGKWVNTKQRAEVIKNEY